MDMAVLYRNQTLFCHVCIYMEAVECITSVPQYFDYPRNMQQNKCLMSTHSYIDLGKWLCLILFLLLQPSFPSSIFLTSSSITISLQPSFPPSLLQYTRVPKMEVPKMEGVLLSYLCYLKFPAVYIVLYCAMTGGVNIKQHILYDRTATVFNLPYGSTPEY